MLVYRDLPGVSSTLAKRVEIEVIGRTLSHYRIVSEVGSGGMGVVYLARDERLKRDVAVKVLPPDALADEAARKRFRREATTLSQLNHPNIETVFDFDTQDGIDFLVMEYVAGPSLEERLAEGPLPEREAIAIGVQVAEALEAAHAKGIVHRDLKPSNIGIASDGRAKVLDFGLARLLRPVRNDSTTKTILETAGIAGTLPYMAPEQLLGERVDWRADLYALGVVLFQVAVGRLPFEEKLPTALVNDVLHMPPPLPTKLNHRVTERLEAIVLRCLEKDPANRYQTASDLRADLNRLRRDSEVGAGGGKVYPRALAGWKPWWRRRPGAVAASAIVLAGLVLWFVTHRKPSAPMVTHRQVTFSGSTRDPAISPDGQYCVYVERSPDYTDRLVLLDLSGGQSLEVFAAQHCQAPRWSPDGSQILAASWGPRDSVMSAVLVPRFGGAARKFGPVGSALCWASDGKRFVTGFQSRQSLLITDIATGDTSSVRLDASIRRVLDLDWSPRGDRILMLATNTQDRAGVWAITSDGKTLDKVIEDAAPVSSPRWSPTGDAIYFVRSRGQGQVDELCRIRYTPGRTARRAPVVLLEGIKMGSQFTVSRVGGRLLYLRTTPRVNLHGSDVPRVHAARNRPIRVLTTGTLFDTWPEISPDGKWIAFARGGERTANIYAMPIGGGAPRQLTFLNSSCWAPVWSPGGDTIAFACDEGGVARLWRVPATGGPARPYANTLVSDRRAPIAWSPSGDLLYQLPAGGAYTLMNPRTGATSSLGSPDSLGAIFYARFSPDGRRVAWWSPDARGVWTMSLADRSRRPLLRDGPAVPLGWSADMQWVFICDFRTHPNRLIRMRASGDGAEVLMDLPGENDLVNAAISRDGRKLVISVSSEQADVWLAENYDPRPVK